MPANTTPIFVLQGNLQPARIQAANSDNSGAGTLVTLVTAGANGTRVDGIRFNNSGASTTASTATRVNMFLTTGATIRLIGQVLFPAGTAKSATNLGATAIYTFDQPLIMQSGQVLSVTSTNWATTADNIDACPFAGDY
jgi:hypothetical protein